MPAQQKPIRRRPELAAHRLLTVRETAERLGVSYRHARALIARSAIRSVVVGHDGRGPIIGVTRQGITAYRRRVKQRKRR